MQVVGVALMGLKMPTAEQKTTTAETGLKFPMVEQKTTTALLRATTAEQASLVTTTTGRTKDHHGGAEDPQGRSDVTGDHHG